MKQIFATILALTLLVFSFTIPALAEDEIVINWPTMWCGSDAKTAPVKRIVEAYNAKNEGKIKVVMEEIPDTATYDNKIVADIANQNVPDIFTLKWNSDTRSYYESDLLMDLTEVVDSGWLGTFAEGSLEEARINGQIKALPYEIGITPVWYNTKLFEQAGIEKFPETFDEMWTAFDKLKAIGVVPTSQMTGSNNAFTTQMWFSAIVDSLGGVDVWEKPLTDPVFAQAATLTAKLFADGNTTNDAIGASAAVSSGHYLAERTAMFTNGPWFIGNIRTNAPEVYDVTEIAPMPAAGEYKGGQVYFTLTLFAAANTQDEAKKAAVLDFLKYLCSPEVAKEISLEAGSLLTPVFEFSPDDKVDPLQIRFQEELENAAFLGGRFDNKVSVAALAEFGPGMDELIAGRITAEEFVQRLADANE